MTIDELKKRLNKIDPRLYLECVVSDIDDLNEPTGVWFKAPTKIDWQLFRIDKNDFYFEPIISEIAAVNQFIGLDAVKEVGDLLFKYFEPELSKDSQTISNDSKNENGSTAALDKFLSKDSQKKTKEQLIYDFVDETMKYGFKVSQEVANHKTIKIDIVFENEFNTVFRIDIEDVKNTDLRPFEIIVNLVNNKQLSKLSWLFGRASKLVSDLRSM